MNWYLDVLKKYAVFSNGRSRRKEYWMFFLINIIIAIVLGFIEGIMGGPGIISSLYSLAVLLPEIGVSIRRLHDTNRSGWWLFILSGPDHRCDYPYCIYGSGQPAPVKISMGKIQKLENTLNRISSLMVPY